MAGPPPARPFAPPPAPAAGIKVAVFAADRPTVMVVSHERSGTHFLMNAIARTYGYVSRPWINLDHDEIAINFFATDLLAKTLDSFASRRVANVIKSHHAVEFFDGILDDVLKTTTIFYIHRDPVSVMLSYWRFINHWSWREGPKRGDPLAFARAEPEGQQLRYQMVQRRSMLDRWACHVEGWVKAADRRPRLRLVRYDDLRDDYARTLKSFRDLLRVKPLDLTPPPPDRNVIARAAAVGDTDVPERDALRALALAEVGKTMKALGYG